MVLVRVHDNEWAFQDPTLTNDIEEMFNDALEAYDGGAEYEAEELVRDVLAECPNHIDALHHLGVFLGEREEILDSYAYCQAAVSVGLQAIPSDFRWDGDRISWSELDNRPFLRAYHTLAVHRMDQGAWHDAIVILKRLLTVNPSDNQGARHMLPQCWFEVKDAAAVVDHCQRYRGDAMPEILYSHALALVLVRKKAEAQAVLRDCVKRLPLVAEELLSRVHPEPVREYPGAVTFGGADQAWDYWKAYGRYWRKSKTAKAMLRAAHEEAQ